MESSDLGGGIVRKIGEPSADAGETARSNSGLKSLVDVPSERRQVERVAPADSPGTPYILVLPFKNASADPEDEYFADGLTEEVITMLGATGSADVIGSQTSFALKNTNFDVREAGDTLGVSFAIDGTVKKSNDQVLISVNLVDTSTRRQVWGDTFDCALKDIHSVQSEITSSIVGSLGIELETTMLRRALKKPPEHITAYDCLLRAYQNQIKPSEERHATAREYLEKAVSLDPGYARARSELARVYLGEELFGWNRLPDPLGRAKEMAETAVQLDRRDPFAHHVLAMVHHQRKEFTKFASEASRCLESNPTDSRLLADLGILYTCLGKGVLGVNLLRKAQRLNPFHPDWYYLGFVFDNYDRRSYRDAVVELGHMDTPGFFWKYVFLAASHGQLGELDQAESARRTLAELYPEFPSHVDRELDRWGFHGPYCDHVKEGLEKAGVL